MFLVIPMLSKFKSSRCYKASIFYIAQGTRLINIKHISYKKIIKVHLRIKIIIIRRTSIKTWVLYQMAYATWLPCVGRRDSGEEGEERRGKSKEKAAARQRQQQLLLAAKRETRKREEDRERSSRQKRVATMLVVGYKEGREEKGRRRGARRQVMIQLNFYTLQRIMEKNKIFDILGKNQIKVAIQWTDCFKGNPIDTWSTDA